MKSKAARTLIAATSGASVLAGAMMLTTATATAATLQEGGSPLRNGTIGYVLVGKKWSVYETEGGATECPQGFNDGPREQFKQLFSDGKKRSIVEAQLKREGEQWHPTTEPDGFRFLEAQGNTSYGLNLDGKAGPEDFQNPEGEAGIDNQLYRVLGCIAQYRTGGTFNHFENLFMSSYEDARILIELTQVDDLTNDDDVTVTFYRGSDRILQDATGEGFVPGGTQRVDMRWGKQFITELKGRIANGVLTTDPVDRALLPWGVTFNTSGYHVLRGMQLKLQLQPQEAEGLIGGYVDVAAFNHHVNTSWSTHHHSYGQLSSPSQYRAMRRLADGYPDEQTGENTAISGSISVKFVQVYIVHPEQQMVTQR